MKKDLYDEYLEMKELCERSAELSKKPKATFGVADLINGKIPSGQVDVSGGDTPTPTPTGPLNQWPEILDYFNAWFEYVEGYSSEKPADRTFDLGYVSDEDFATLGDIEDLFASLDLVGLKMLLGSTDEEEPYEPAIKLGLDLRTYEASGFPFVPDTYGVGAKSAYLVGKHMPFIFEVRIELDAETGDDRLTCGLRDHLVDFGSGVEDPLANLKLEGTISVQGVPGYEPQPATE